MQWLSFAIEYKLLERELEATYIDPRDTSPRCPRCRFTGNRDVIACTNMFLRYSRCAGSGAP